MTDDGRPDSTMWGNPWFWAILAGTVAVWVVAGVALWEVFR